jgi:hypothetical protein
VNFTASIRDSDSEPDLNAWLPKNKQKKVNVVQHIINMLRASSPTSTVNDSESKTPTTEFLPAHADLFKSSGLVSYKENMFSPELKRPLASECSDRKKKEDYNFNALLSPAATAAAPVQTTDPFTFTEDTGFISQEDEIQESMDLGGTLSVTARSLFQSPSSESFPAEDSKLSHDTFNHELFPTLSQCSHLQSPVPKKTLCSAQRNH